MCDISWYRSCDGVHVGPEGGSEPGGSPGKRCVLPACVLLWRAAMTAWYQLVWIALAAGWAWVLRDGW